MRIPTEGSVACDTEVTYTCNEVFFTGAREYRATMAEENLHHSGPV